MQKKFDAKIAIFIAIASFILTTTYISSQAPFLKLDKKENITIEILQDIQILIFCFVSILQQKIKIFLIITLS